MVMKGIKLTLFACKIRICKDFDSSSYIIGDIHGFLLSSTLTSEKKLCAPLYFNHIPTLINISKKKYVA